MKSWCIFSLLSFLLFVSINSSKGQQYIPFAQHVFHATSVNPAYTGYKDHWYGQVGVRSQWASLKGAPKSGYVSVDGVLDDEFRRHAGGIVMSYDKIGVQSATSFFVNYALRLQIDDSDDQRLHLGLAGGFTQYSLNGKDLTYIDEGDPYIPSGIISTWRPDLRLGVFYYNPNWYLGVSVHDLFSNADSREDFVFNQNSLEGLYRNTHGYFMAGAAFAVSEGMVFRPSILVKDDFIGPTALDINAMLIFDQKLWVGIAGRTRSKIFDREYEDLSLSKFSSYKSIGLLAQIFASEKLRIGYSFEHSLNKIAGMNSGTHELSLGVSLGRIIRNPYGRPKYF